MGQKVNPLGFRIGVGLQGGWKSIACNKALTKKIIVQDWQIRNLIAQIYPKGQIGNVIIEHPHEKSIIINIHAKKSAVIVGKTAKGNDSKQDNIVDRLKLGLSKIAHTPVSAINIFEKTGKETDESYDSTNSVLSSDEANRITINVFEIAKPDLNAKILAETIAAQIESRSPYKNAMRRAISNARKQGAKGAKALCSGRLGGAELARDDKYQEGCVPLHTLRADIDYALAEAQTTYGKIGIKVWVNR